MALGRLIFQKKTKKKPKNANFAKMAKTGAKVFAKCSQSVREVFAKCSRSVREVFARAAGGPNWTEKPISCPKETKKVKKTQSVVPRGCFETCSAYSPVFCPFRHAKWLDRACWRRKTCDWLDLTWSGRKNNRKNAIFWLSSPVRCIFLAQKNRFWGKSDSHVAVLQWFGCLHGGGSNSIGQSLTFFGCCGSGPWGETFDS